MASLRNRLSRRCVVNCPAATPPCPPCGEGETCRLIAQSCESCAVSICVPSEPESPPASDDGDGGSSVGAIAGGVVGGIAFLIVLGLAFWFYRRRKAATAVTESWIPEKRDGFTPEQHARRTRVGSMASTVMTRASNVIQIAYIPGVTNRSPPDSPAVLVPPVPPIPGNNFDQEHYFLPGDIRDSVWSQMTEDQRKSIAPSLNRSSVATTIYRNNAIVSPVPAQQALRVKPAMVSVKSASGSPVGTPRSLTPAVPSITSTQLDKAQAVSNALGMSSIVARSGVARPIQVTKPKSKANLRSEGSDKAPEVRVEGASDAESLASSKNIKARESTQSGAVTVIEDSPAVRQSPFADPHSKDGPFELPATSSARQSVDLKRGSFHQRRQSSRSAAGRLSPEAARRNSNAAAVDPSKRSKSPFADENEVK